MSEVRHPDTPRLLAWIDRELSLWRSWHVGRHVKRCWQCRTRVSELEAAIGGVAQRLQPAELSSVELAKARWRFREAAAELEASLAPARQQRPPALLLAGAAAALCFAVFSWRTAPVSAPEQPSARGLLNAALSAETPPPRGTVREERFTVEYSAGRGPLARRELRLLSSPKRNAWTARWSTEDGELRNAVFASESQEYSRQDGLRPAVFRRSGEYKGLLDYAASDVEGMILQWIRSQVWQPVSLAREVSEFCNRTGAVLRLSIDGTAVLWTAESSTSGVRIVVHLEAVRGGAPTVLRVSWQSGNRSGTIRIKRESRREYDDVRLAAALLYPSIAAPQQAKVEPMPRNGISVPPEPAIPLSELLAAEVSVLHALHRARLCTTDAVRVSRLPDAIEVSGSFAGEDTTDRTAALLAGIPHVRLRLATINANDVAPLEIAVTTIDRQARPAAAEAWLRSRLGVGVRSSEREMFNTMNAVVRDAEDLLSDSWALLKLSERFPPEVETEMDAETRSRLRKLADDHIVTISVQVAAIDGRLALQQTDQEVDGAVTVWQTSARSLHASARKTAEMLLSLFAGGDSARIPSTADPEQAGIAAMIGRVRSMATLVRGELNGEMRSARE